jgi:hypothetical protein
MEEDRVSMEDSFPQKKLPRDIALGRSSAAGLIIPWNAADASKKWKNPGKQLDQERLDLRLTFACLISNSWRKPLYQMDLLIFRHRHDVVPLNAGTPGMAAFGTFKNRH